MKRIFSGEKSRISVDIDTDDYELLKAYAARNGKKVSEYTREVLLASIPRRIVEAYQDSDENPVDVVDKLFAMQDEALGEDVESVDSLKIPEKPKEILHPCLNLKPENVPRTFEDGGCQGMCSAQDRVCFWDPSSARQCQFFSPNGAYRSKK